jgi:uncharacterized RDD family membrane protein YckC
LNPTDVVGRRVGAFIIDGIISWAVSVGIFFATTKTSNTTCGLTPEADAWQGVGTEAFGDCRFFTSGGSFAAYLGLSLGFAIGLFWAWPALTGYTPGKAIVGIRIIRRNGAAPGFGRVFVRQLMWIVDAFPYIVPYLTGFLVANGDKDRHQRLGDRAAGTFVIDKKAFGSFVPDQQQAGGPPAYQTSPQAFNAGPPPPPAPATPAAAAPGWYDDPERQARLRYWDGAAWTQHTSA